MLARAMPLLVRHRLCFKQPGPRCRRLRGKQPAPPWFRPNAIAAGFAAGIAAVGVEQNAVDGLMPLPQDGRRRHVHYTHVRTTCLDDVQPHRLTREAFWQHLERCYRAVHFDEPTRPPSPEGGRRSWPLEAAAGDCRPRLRRPPSAATFGGPLLASLPAGLACQLG